MCCSAIHHGHLHEANARVYPLDEADYCQCHGTDDDGKPNCCGAKTGDDGLCDRCREHCKNDKEHKEAARPRVAKIGRAS